ncbi:50S ribosome-binding GTPase [bacterium]|jgi:Obg family GTPase CgtA|nr:50S ribosome-binding GTPase [bacterium]|mmetsp:Transcript_5167/g.23266  ORF Transcript_5167/g.23266 Transcript_5167/m.23266 type:complete len:488 (+) Transcript_5167:276-1739(+)
MLKLNAKHMWSVRANLTILLTNDTRWESQTFTCMHRVERSFSASPTHLFKTPSQHPRRQAGRSSAEEENNYGDHKLQHLYFDEVTITVSGGQGGDGEAWLASKPKTVRNFKYKWGRNTKKFIELPAAEPADGGRGGNVYIRVDRSCESLLHIHQRKLWRAKKGYHGSSAPHATPGRGRRRIALTQEDLYINVPAGTVVRRKRSGELLGDMTSHGMAILVAEGGAGGLAACSSQQIRSHRHKGLNEVEVSDFGFEEAPRTTTRGETGEEVTLELLMRVVADIGIVGLPNAGKSSILKAITRATPEVASYPFTTLMPNIGVIKSVRVGSDEIDGSDLPTIGLPVLADLPGLIKGAHKGRGLGRAFLRHLRRTRAMMIVVDVSGQNPTSDYLTIREELRLYNPDYILRPHILVLNKIDVEWAAIQVQEITTEFQSLCESVDGPAPIAVLPVSAVTGSGLDILISELVEALRLCDENHANARASAPKDTTP